MASSVYLLLITLLFILLCPLSYSLSASGNKVLVVLDSLENKPIYSKFWADLEERGFSLNFKANTDKDFKIFNFGERQTDHLIIFSTSKSLGGDLTVASLADFVSSGGNIVIASDNVSIPLREICFEFGVEFDRKNTMIIDHWNYNVLSTHVNATSNKHDSILSFNVAQIPAILSKKVSSGVPILFQGIAHRIIRRTPLLVPILRGNSASFTAVINGNTVQGNDFSYGSEIGIVTALQARNNARVVISGSLKLFSDEYAETAVQVAHALKGTPKKFDKPGNEEFVKDLSKWTFQEKGVIAFESSHHHRLNENEQNDFYYVNDHIVYSAEMKEWNGKQWVPFVADDVQFEAKMLDPRIRTFMKATTSTKSAQMYTTDVRLPAQIGIYTFKVNYQRPGYSYILQSELVPLRNIRHDMFPRFLESAYVYYIGALSQMIASFLFFFVWLSQRVKNTQKKTN